MNEIIVGKTKNGIKLALPLSVRSTHVQIVGSTGRGKTESVIIPWMVQDLIQDRTAVLIDGKGDKSIYELLKAVSYEELGQENNIAYFDIGHIDESMTTNPLKYGSPQQITDRLFASLEFDNIYFKNVSYSACLLIAQMIFAQTDINKSEISFKKIFKALTDDGELSEIFSGVRKDMGSNFEADLSKFLNQKFSDRQEKLSGLISQIEPLAQGELSEILNGPVNGKDFFSLTEILFSKLSRVKNKYKCAVILISTLLYQQSASILGKIFLQEIGWAIAMKEKEKDKRFAAIFLDEFSAFVYQGFSGILNKARSTNTALHIAHQSLGDLTEISPGFAQAIHTNTNVKCVLGLNDPESADFFAKHFGTREVVEATERAQKSFFGDLQRSGDLNVRQSEAYKIHPNKIKSFTHGQGVISLSYAGKAITEEIQFFRSPFQLGGA